jgi:ankyrin repeat protein
MVPCGQASREGHLDVVLRLLRAKAFPVPRTFTDGGTPLHEACREGHVDLARELLMAAASHLQSKTKAGGVALGGRSDLFGSLDLFGPDPRDLGGNTPLHEACREGHVDVCSDLLAAGANQGLRNANGGRVILPWRRGADSTHSSTVPVLSLLEASPCGGSITGRFF